MVNGFDVVSDRRGSVEVASSVAWSVPLRTGSEAADGMRYGGRGSRWIRMGMEWMRRGRLVVRSGWKELGCEVESTWVLWQLLEVFSGFECSSKERSEPVGSQGDFTDTAAPGSRAGGRTLWGMGWWGWQV